MSSSISLLPSPGVSMTSLPNASGNLLSNIQPPSALPSFVVTAKTIQSTTIIPTTQIQSVTSGDSQPSSTAPLNSTQFR